jgi:hypothetical protein
MAADSLRETHRGHGVIVPYCTDCHFHASSVGTRRLGVLLSSLLLGATLSASMPLLGLETGPVAFVLLVVAGSLLPLAFAWLPWRPVALGHTARGRAVWWTRDGALACTNARWGEELATAAGVEGRRLRVREPLLSATTLVGPALALLLSPMVYVAEHPPLRILNLTPALVFVEVDGRRVGAVEPTSQESPRAGVTLRVLAGQRSLRVVDAEGTLVDERDAQLTMDAEHLYAPGADGTCFWVETTSYGRERDQAVDRVVAPLGHGSGFWTIPGPVDTWFAPNPATSSDARSTGGRLTALRQAACLDAPAAVRALVRRGARGTFAPAGE